MTYEEKKKVVEAAQVLKKYCSSMEDCERDCIFRTGNGCLLSEDYPVDWYIPAITRWTPEDVALAKALKAFGADRIERFDGGVVGWLMTGASMGKLPYAAFNSLVQDEIIDLDTIISEAAEV